jgi:hypothetical protein
MKNRPTVLRYNDLASLVHRIREQKPSCYITVVLSAHDMDLHTAYQDRQRRIATRRSSKTTVLIHDEAGMSSFVPESAPQHTQRRDCSSTALSLLPSISLEATLRAMPL